MMTKSKLCKDISTALGLSAAALTLSLLPSSSVLAAEIDWIGANTDPSWTNPGNWLNGVAPQAGDDVRLTDANLSGVANVQATYANPSNIGSLNSLVIDGANIPMTLLQNGDDLSTVTLTVGDVGSGTYNMNGGTLEVTNTDSTVQTFVLGNQVGATGNFNQYGGTVTVGNDISLGQSIFSLGIYNIDGTQGNGAADLNVAGYITMGFGGQGFINQSANSVVTVGSDIYMANSSNYNISGGGLVVNGSQGLLVDTGSAVTQYGGAVTVSVADLVVGDNAGGTYYQDNSLANSVVNVAGNLSIGRAAGANGVYTFSDQGSGNQLSLNVAGSINVGEAGAGTFNQIGNAYAGSPGGTVTTNNLDLGQLAGSQGAYNLLAGALLIQQGNLTVGDQGAGIFYQDNSQGNSSVTITQNTALPPSVAGNSWSTGNLYIGGSPTLISAGNPGGTGTYQMLDTGSGNQLSLTVAGEIFIGGNNQNGQFACQAAAVACNGAFIQDGGTVTVDHSANSAYGYYADIQIGINGGSGSYILDNNGTLTTPNTIEVGNTSTGNTFTQYSGTVNTGNIWLANAGGSGGTYNLNGGTLNSGVVVGVGGAGVFINAGGAQYGGDVVLAAFGAGSSGSYSLTSANSILNANNIVVGQEGQGQFNQYAGAVSAQTLSIGGSYADGAVTGNGEYALSGGVLTISSYTVVGATSQGAVSQIGGTFNAGYLSLGGAGLSASPNSTLSSGYQLNSSGSYDLEGGILNTTGTTVSVFGLGSFTQGGASTQNVAGDLIVGQNPALAEPITGVKRSGMYSLNGGQLNVSGNSIIGGANSATDPTWASQPGGQGAFNQTGGNFQTTSLIVGQGGTVAGGTGSYNLYNGASLSTLATTIGSAGIQGGVGTFNQYGGTHATANLTIGGINANGAYLLFGGALNVTGYNPATLDNGQTYIGESGNGLFIQAGASQFTTNYLSIGSEGGGGNGLYNFSAGALTVNNNMAVGTVGSGEFAQSGGVVNVSQNLYLGGAAGSSGLYNLNGGSLQAYYFQENATGVLSENIGQGASYLTANFASFGGEIKVGAGTNFAPTVGETFILAQISGSYSYSGLNIDTSALVGDTFRINYDQNDISLTVLTAATVPVPAGFWLFGSGLLGLLGLRRKAQ